MKRTRANYTPQQKHILSMSRCYYTGAVCLRAPSRRAASRTLLQLSYLDCGTGEEAGVGLTKGKVVKKTNEDGRVVTMDGEVIGEKGARTCT